MLSNETLNAVVSVRIMETHTLETIEGILKLVANKSRAEEREIWEKNGVLNFAEDMNEAMLVLMQPQFESWKIEHEKLEGFACVEIECGDECYEVRGCNLARVICLTALLAIGTITKAELENGILDPYPCTANSICD